MVSFHNDQHVCKEGTSKCRRSFINGDLTGHVRDGHLVGLYLHSLSSCSSILGSWNGQPETLNLHLVLWPLNKKLISINLLIRWFDESCFHQIYCLFWTPQNGFLFENQNIQKNAKINIYFLSKKPKTAEIGKIYETIWWVN